MFNPLKANAKLSWRYQKSYSNTFYYKGANINYIKVGKGSSLLLLHGGGSFSYTYRNNIKELSNIYTLYLIDMPGHGYSQIPLAWSYSLCDVSELLLCFAKEIIQGKFHLMGHSWGGGWAIYLKHLYPQLVLKTVLISPSGIKESNELDKSLYPYLKIKLFEFLISIFINFTVFKFTYQHSLLFDKNKISLKELKVLYSSFIKKNNLSSQAKYQKKLDWSLTENPSKSLKDTLIIWGREDKFYPLEMMNKYHADKLIMNHCGHLPHEERSEYFNQIIIKFLN